MTITDEERLLIEDLIVKLETEIDTNIELITVLHEILDNEPAPDIEPVPGLEVTRWRILAEPYLNVRTEPTIDSTDIGNISTGALVNVYERLVVGDDLWGVVEIGLDNYAWIALELGVNIFAEKIE